MTEVPINYSRWCSMLSTQGHHECRGCDCTCHELGAYGGVNLTPRRPHSFPLPDWEAGRRPHNWKQEKALRRAQERQEQLLGLV